VSGSRDTRRPWWVLVLSLRIIPSGPRTYSRPARPRPPRGRRLPIAVQQPRRGELRLRRTARRSAPLGTRCVRGFDDAGHLLGRGWFGLRAALGKQTHGWRRVVGNPAPPDRRAQGATDDRVHLTDRRGRVGLALVRAALDHCAASCGALVGQRGPPAGGPAGSDASPCGTGEDHRRDARRTASRCSAYDTAEDRRRRAPGARTRPV
jgi:hypothetical protein